MRKDDLFISDSPYRSERQRAAEERRKQQVIDQAEQQSGVLQKISHERAEQKATEKLLFCMWYMLDKELEVLEKMRDENEPASPEEPWNDDFCYAISKIPEVKKTCEEVWYEYTSMKGGD